MITRPKTCAVVLLAVLGELAACSGSAGSTERDAGVDSGSERLVLDASLEGLCDGSEGLRFGYWILGARFSLADYALQQNGSYSLFIDGACRAYTLNGGWSRVRSRQLAAADLESLESELPIGELRGLASVRDHYCVDVHDLPTFQYLVGDAQFVAADCAPEQLEWVEFERLHAAILAVIRRLHPDGEASTGPVRYVVFPYVNFGRPLPEDWEGAPPWPLAEDPEGLAVRDTNLPLRDVVHIATGEDAEALRDLRHRFVNGEFGRLGRGLPIEQPDGRRYWLYLRDTHPFEDEDGFIRLDAAAP